MKARTWIFFVAVFFLAACDQNTGTPSPATNAAPAAETITPKDPALAKLYAQTCKSCHATPGSGAPQTGNRQEWDARFGRGMKMLLDRTIGGYKGMPPLGGCADCSEEDFEKLIKFMAGRQ